MSRRIGGFSPGALAAMADYPWPGNVRELQNAIERAVVLCKGDTIEAAHFPFTTNGHVAAATSLTLASAEEAHIRKVLATMSFNVAQAARALEIDRVTLYNKMRKYGIDRP